MNENAATLTKTCNCGASVLWTIADLQRLLAAILRTDRLPRHLNIYEQPELGVWHTPCSNLECSYSFSWTTQSIAAEIDRLQSPTRKETDR